MGHRCLVDDKAVSAAKLGIVVKAGVKMAAKKPCRITQQRDSQLTAAKPGATMIVESGGQRRGAVTFARMLLQFYV